jgi:hypothetical protein
MSLVSTHEVEPTDGGATVHDRFLQPKGKGAAPAFEMFKEMFASQFGVELARLVEVVQEWMSGPADQPEPDLPVADESKRLATSVQT